MKLRFRDELLSKYGLTPEEGTVWVRLEDTLIVALDEETCEETEYATAPVYVRVGV